MNINKVILFILIGLIMYGCTNIISIDNNTDPNDDSNNTFTPVELIPDSIVQPLPSNASSVRLNLPASLDNIKLSSIGGFGAHNGTHIEGLDHIWMYIKESAEVGSWADGVVTDVREVESEYYIEIDYGSGLNGVHMEVQTPLVSKGDNVKEGQIIGIGMSWMQGYESAEFTLRDQNRNDGVSYGSAGCAVSPFDYLRDDVKQNLIQAYKQQVLDPYISNGVSTYNVYPWEPFLNNPVLIHWKYKGKLTGEWILLNGVGAGGWPDIITFLDIDNMYYKGTKVLAIDDNEAGAFSGVWEADYTNRRIKITSGTILYGIFEISEVNGKDRLKIEYQEGSYPGSFSSNAATYFERNPLPRRQDISQNSGP